MTQKKRGSDSLKMGRDARPTVEGCEYIQSDKPVGLTLANVFHSTAQAKIMVSSGGTRGSLSNQKRILNELVQGKQVNRRSTTIGKDNNNPPKSKKKSTAQPRKQSKPISNLSISTKDRISIERMTNDTPDKVEAKLGLRSIRVLHKFITNSLKITLNVRHHEPVTMKMFQGYGDQEREIGTLISF